MALPVVRERWKYPAVDVSQAFHEVQDASVQQIPTRSTNFMYSLPAFVEGSTPLLGDREVCHLSVGMPSVCTSFHRRVLSSKRFSLYLLNIYLVVFTFSVSFLVRTPYAEIMPLI